MSAPGTTLTRGQRLMSFCTISRRLNIPAIGALGLDVQRHAVPPAELCAPIQSIGAGASIVATAKRQVILLRGIFDRLTFLGNACR
jgi:hypothetical protein